MTLTVAVLSKIPNLLKELVKAVPNVHFFEVPDPDNNQQLQSSQIIISDFNLIAAHIYNLPNARWLQGTWAGVDKLLPFIKKSEPPLFPVTRFTGDSFGRIMSEYIIANIVNHERKLFEVRENQAKKIWNKEGKINNYRTIFDLSVGILGLGSIGQRIGRTLQLLGGKVLAAGKRPFLPKTMDFEFIQEYYTMEDLDSFLKACDYVITVLPKTGDTDGLLDNDILKNCQHRQAVLINVGRSNIISEESLIRALDNKWLSAAILDVFDQEPLPSSSPLWTKAEVFVTPHVSATSRAEDIAQQFRSNLELYQQNRPIPATVDFSKEY